MCLVGAIGSTKPGHRSNRVVWRQWRGAGLCPRRKHASPPCRRWRAHHLGPSGHALSVSAVRAPGTLVIVTDVDHVRHYRVSHKQIANASTDAINPAAMPGGLVLVTCYPFDALQAGGSERYLVFAHPIGTT